MLTAEKSQCSNIPYGKDCRALRGVSSEEPWLENPARDLHGGSLSRKNPARNPHGPQLWRPCRVGGKVPFLEERKESA